MSHIRANISWLPERQVAHHLGSGEWMLMLLDGADLKALSDLAERCALHHLPGMS